MAFKQASLRFVARQNGNFSIVGWTLGQVIGNAGYECAKRRDFAEEKPRYCKRCVSRHMYLELFLTALVPLDS